MSSSPSSYEKELHDHIPCLEIYSKEFQHGTLYGMRLKTPKSDANLDKQILALDAFFSRCSPDKRTRFTSIYYSPSLSGKIKTFAVGTHGEDMHFKELFASDYAGRKELDPLPGVRKWTPTESVLASADDGAGAVFDENDESGEDEDIQSPDPKPNGKRRAEVSSIDPSKKLRSSDGDSVAGEESALEEVHRLREELAGSKAEIEELKKEIVSVCLFHCLR